MKKYYYLLIIPLFFIHFSSAGQKAEWSTPEKITDRITYAEIVGAYNKNYYIVRYNKKSNQKFLIERFDNNLSLTKKVEFEANKEVILNKFILVDNILYVFTHSYDKEKKLYCLYANVYNQDLSLTVSNKLLASTPFKDSDKKPFYVFKDQFHNRLVVIYLSETSGNLLTFNFKVFNIQLDILNDNNFSITKEKEITFDQFTLTDSNLVILYKKSSVKFQQQTFYQYSIVNYNLKNNKQKIFKFFEDTIRVSNLLCKYNNYKKDITICGFYSQGEAPEYKGLVYMKLFPKKDTAFKNIINFDKEIVGSLIGKTSKSQGIKDFYPKNMVTRSDGGFIFVGEYYNVVREVYNDYNTFSNSYTRYYYQYSDLLVLSVNPDTSIDWSKVIRKEQVSMSDDGYYSSFISGTDRDKIIILYNDISRTNTNLMLSKIDPGGNVENSILVNGSSFKGSLIPKMGKQVSNNEVLIPGFENKKGFFFMRITF